MNLKRYEIILIVLVIVAFVSVALARLYPYQNSLQQLLNDTGNDWSKYAAFALDIKNNGLLMPAVNEAYERPASFFYCYFLALCFFFFGENTVPVFLLQNLMLGLSVVFVYLTFRERISAQLKPFFLATLFVSGLADVSIYYTFRLLGENLGLFSMSLFFFLFFRGIEKNKLLPLLFSAVFLGITILTRANVALFGIIIVLLLTWQILKPQGLKIKPVILFSTTLFIVSSFLAFRNYFYCHCLQFFPSQGFAYNLMAFHPIPSSVTIPEGSNLLGAYMQYLLQEPIAFFSHYLKKILFCFGFLKTLDPAYRWMPHWTVMWAWYFVYLFFVFREKTKLLFTEKAVHLFILTYFGSLVLMAQIENYGFRMLVPGNFFVLSFAFIAFDKLFQRINIKSGRKLQSS